MKSLLIILSVLVIGCSKSKVTPSIVEDFVGKWKVTAIYNKSWNNNPTPETYTFDQDYYSNGFNHHTYELKDGKIVLDHFYLAEYAFNGNTLEIHQNIALPLNNNKDMIYRLQRD